MCPEKRKVVVKYDNIDGTTSSLFIAASITINRALSRIYERAASMLGEHLH